MVTGIHYTRYGRFHRDDGPAIIYTNNIRYWYKNGKLTNGLREW
jgi:hypothetical protein